MGVLLCNEDNKIYLLFKMSNKDGNSETKKGDDEICTFLAKTEKQNEITIMIKIISINST